MLLPSFYFAPAIYYRLLLEDVDSKIDLGENFTKQTYRNRLCLYSANGQLNLSIPLRRWKNNTPTKDIFISFEEKWQVRHWRAICAAYSRSPFFEYFEFEFNQLYSTKVDRLIEWNKLCFDTISKLSQMPLEYKVEENYFAEKGYDSIILSTKNDEVKKHYSFPFYLQTFNEKHGFIPNLSIIDVLFNLGAETSTYLKTITPKTDGKEN